MATRGNRYLQGFSAFRRITGRKGLEPPSPRAVMEGAYLSSCFPPSGTLCTLSYSLSPACLWSGDLLAPSPRWSSMCSGTCASSQSYGEVKQTFIPGLPTLKPVHRTFCPLPHSTAFQVSNLILCIPHSTTLTQRSYSDHICYIHERMNERKF